MKIVSSYSDGCAHFTCSVNRCRSATEYLNPHDPSQQSTYSHVLCEIHRQTHSITPLEIAWVCHEKQPPADTETPKVERERTCSKQITSSRALGWQARGNGGVKNFDWKEIRILHINRVCWKMCFHRRVGNTMRQFQTDRSVSPRQWSSRLRSFLSGTHLALSWSWQLTFCLRHAHNFLILTHAIGNEQHVSLGWVETTMIQLQPVRSIAKIFFLKVL